MFPTGAFNQPSFGYPFPGQQPLTSMYQSQFGGITGFNPALTPTFPQVPATRGQSLPAAGRQYPPPTGPYGPPPTQTAPPLASTTSRRQQIGQYPPPPAPSQHYEYRSSHGSKSKKSTRRSVSPNAAAEQGLYSDQEQQQQRKERREPSEGQPDSRTQSPTVASRSKQEGVTDNDQQQQQSHGVESVNDETGQQGSVARSEEEQAIGENERHKSSSKKKKHHRRDRYENYNTPPTQPAPPPLDINPNNPFQQPYPSQQYGQQPPYFNEYQNELPPQLKVHRQPLYSSYNQAYEESIRRGDVYRKQAKRSTRLPPEVKQQLLPHEDDQRNQSPAQPGPPAPRQQQPQPVPQTYPYGPVSGYPQPHLPPQQPLQPYGTIRQPFNPYQPYGPPPTQPNYYGSVPGTTPYNALQPWSNLGGVGGPADQEIQRLRSHIHTLEGELHKLQRRLSKATINNEGQGGDDDTRSHRRSKRDGAGSPRQTPVIVELNNTTGESSSKKHRHRTTSNISAQPGQQSNQPIPTTQHSGEQQKTGSEFQSTTTTDGISGQHQNQQVVGDRERSRSGGNQISEGDNKVVPPKNPREETAAQLAHAAAAHVNNRQVGVGAAPLPQQQQQHQQQQQPQQTVVAPPPPPVPQLNRPQLPNQQQQQQQQQQHQQQQFLYQQGVLPPQGQQIRGPAPRMPAPGNNIRYPVDPYQQQQQQFVHPQQRNIPNPNYNQSNNNELIDTIDDVINQYERHKKQEEQNRSAEKILDAFERFYVNRGNPTTAPMKVKYIPEDINSNNQTSNEHFYQQNTNNNNRYRSTSRSYSSSSQSESIYSNSPVSSRHSLYDNNQQKSTIGPFI